MTKNKELVKNTIIILAGKVCTQFISFLLLPLYTAVLATQEYGTVDLVTTYVGLLAPLITLQLENSVFRYLVDTRNNEKKKTKIITNAYFITILLALLIFIIFIVAANFIEISYKYYICGMVFSVICSNMLLQTARGNGNNKDYSIGSVISGGITIILNVVFLVVWKLGITGMFLATIIANLLCAVYIFIREKIYRNIDIQYINKKEIYILLKYSLPLVPNGIIWWIINVSDRTIISIVLGSAANGIYSVSNKFSNVFIQIYNIFNLSWTETASLHINDEDRDEFFSNTIQKMFVLFSSICIGIIAIMPFIFNILINNQYEEAYRYIPLLMIASLFNVIVGLISVIYVAKKLTKEIAKTSFFSGVINLLVNIILIKYIGIYAAVVSTIISFATMAIYRFIDIQKYVKIKIDFKIIVNTSLILCSSIILYYINNTILNILNIAIAIIYTVINNNIYIKYIIKYTKEIKEKYFNKNNI